MRSLTEHPPMTIALAALAACTTLALAAVLVPSTIFHGSAVSAEMPAARPLVLPLREKQPLEAYDVVFEKPLFNPGRQIDPAPVQEPAKSALPPLSDYRLVGLVLARGSRLALVERRSAKQVVTLHAGDELDGRRVESIGEDGVHVSGGAAPELLAIPRVNGVTRSGSKDVAGEKRR